MTAARCEALARRARTASRARPRVYRLRLALLAALGDAYILLMVAIPLVLLLQCGAMLASGLGVDYYRDAVLLVPALLIASIHGVWVSHSRPKGAWLSRYDARELFARIDAIGTAVRGPKVHVVLVTADPSVTVVQQPRFGALGAPRYFLLLGLPAMRAMPVPELEALIAHELAHWSKADDRVSAWVYRVRGEWRRLLAVREDGPGTGGALFDRFARWYTPLFTAYSWVLVRTHELAADRAAAGVAGAPALADALVRMSLLAAESPTDDALAAALARDASLAEAHPSLRDRLAALGQPARLPEPVTESAASVFLGERAATVERELRAA